MKVYVNSITGIDDAIVTMFLSKHTLTKELEDHIREVCTNVLNRDGSYATLGVGVTCNNDTFAPLAVNPATSEYSNI